MEEYIKISDDKVKKVVTNETIYDLNELKAELETVKNKIADIMSRLVKCPDNATEEVKGAIDAYNDSLYGSEISALEAREIEINNLLEKLTQS